MKKMKIQFTLFLIVFLGISLCGCDDEKENLTDTGAIELGVHKNEQLYTKTGVPVTNEKLGVFFVKDVEVIKSFEDYKTEVEGKRIILPTGKITVSVSSAQEDKPQWDTPFYYGKTDVNIKGGEIVSAKVECEITNTKVTVQFTESVKEYFSNYEAIVAGDSGELTFEKDEARAGFYATEQLTVTLNLTNKNNGLNFQFKKVFPDILPRYHYKLKFDTNPPGEGGENAGGNIDISINKTDSTEMECTIMIPEYAQLKDMPKAPTTKVASQLTGQEETESTTLSFKKVEGENAVQKQTLTINTTSGGLRNLYMKLSGNFTADGLPEMFDWLNLPDETIKTKLRITDSSSSDESSKSYTLDFTNMVNNYLTSNEKTSKSYEIQIVALDVYHQEIITNLSYTVKPDLNLLTDEPESIWATFAVLKGSMDPTVGTSPQFMYRKSSDSNWTTVQAETDISDNSIVKAFINNLEVGASYSYKVTGYLDGDYTEGDIVEFETAGTPVVPHLNFDNWYSKGTGILSRDTWYLGNSNESIFWDSGNQGANSLSAANPTSPEESNVISGKAALLESKSVANVFAAGNIYTGTFGGVSGLGASLNFGQPYTGRPTKMRGYYQYQPATINKADDPYTSLIGEQDRCNIYIVLTNWSRPFEANTNTGVFVDFDADYILAYGAITEEEAGRDMTEYAPFEIDIQYRRTDVEPTYILIVASASKYGDYFTGGVGSKLYIDEFELEFDYNPASFVGTNSILENK